DRPRHRAGPHHRIARGRRRLCEQAVQPRGGGVAGTGDPASSGATRGRRRADRGGGSVLGRRGSPGLPQRAGGRAVGHRVQHARVPDAQCRAGGEQVPDHRRGVGRRGCPRRAGGGDLRQPAAPQDRRLRPAADPHRPRRGVHPAARSSAVTRLRAPTRWTLRTRLLLLLVVISALGLGAFGVASVLLLERAQMQRVDTQLGQIAAELSVTRRLPPPPSADGPGVPSDFRVLYFDGRGDPTVWLGESPGAGTYPRLPAMDVLSVRARGNGAFTARDRADDTNWRVRTVVRPATEEQPEEGTAAVAMSLTDSEAISRRLHIIELMIGGA